MTMNEATTMPKPRRKTFVLSRSNARLLLSASNFVPYPPYGFDVFGIVQGVPQLLPQMPDVDGDGVVALAVILIPPDLVKQRLRADRLPPPFQQDAQDGEFRGGEGEGAAVQSTL